MPASQAEALLTVGGTAQQPFGKGPYPQSEPPLRSRRIKLRREGAGPLIELRRARAEPRLGAPDKYPQYTDGVGSMRCGGLHIICISYYTRRGTA